VPEREAHVVEALEEPVPLERVEVESVRSDRLRLEVDGELRAGPLGREGLRLLLGQNDRQEADLEAVRAEDVSERRGHDDFEARVLDGPGGVLP
jgi:hypothetical protein